MVTQTVQIAPALISGLDLCGIAVFAASGALAGFTLRAMAIWKGWAIPAYRG